jgi:predicted enzyme related to lactoylglutathione lyase
VSTLRTDADVFKEHFMAGVSYIELHTTDIDKARGFYGELFGWKFESTPMKPRYDMIQTGAAHGGGIMEEAAGSGFWLQYIDVADLEASTKKAAALGGTIVKGATDVPGQGRFAIVSDPSGATFALWQNTKR